MTDIDNRMLNVIMGKEDSLEDEGSISGLGPTASFEEKKEFLCNNIGKLSRDDKLAIAGIAVINGKIDWFYDEMKGCLVNLDSLAANETNIGIISQMCTTMIHRLSHPH
jgi:hypothetical protein